MVCDWYYGAPVQQCGLVTNNVAWYGCVGSRNHPLDVEEIKQIARLQIVRLQQRLAEKDVQLEVTGSALAEIARSGYDPTYGARPLKRVIQQRIENPLAVELLKGELGEGQTVTVDFRGGEFTFEPAEAAAAV